MIIHTVKPGESIYTIARSYNISPDQLIRDNELENPDQLIPGQAIVVLKNNVPHVIQRGQSLYGLSSLYGVSLESIIAANPQITDPSRLSVGQVVQIPIGYQKLGSMDVNGYAFPNISMDVLNRTLPYLTYLSIFSYQVRYDGSLVTINDVPLIEAARNAKVAPFMVITNIEEGGSFSSDLAHTILTNEEVQNNLLNNVEQVLKQKNYYGLDIDFEYIYPYDRESYNNFLRKVVARFRPMGYSITTALAPKISGNQPGLLYEAHDYPVHGALVDHVILMTYEWGYTYGPAQAVAPIDQVSRVLNYAVSVIPSQKILMGMPNYGYDWTLPFVQGSRAQSLSNTRAVALAKEVGANIQFDTKVQAPFFEYYDANGKKHIVWFEDARSVAARLMLVNEYNLGGVSYWTINRFFPQNWLVLGALYDVNKVL